MLLSTSQVMQLWLYFAGRRLQSSVYCKPIPGGQADEDQAAAADFQKSFEVERSRNYQFYIQLDAGGFLSAIRIWDGNQAAIYQSISENISSSGSIYLNEGTYTISVIYLKDIDAFERYCEETDNVIDEAAEEELKSVYEHEVQMPEFSFTIK